MAEGIMDVIRQDVEREERDMTYAKDLAREAFEDGNLTRTTRAAVRERLTAGHPSLAMQISLAVEEQSRSS